MPTPFRRKRLSPAGSCILFMAILALLIPVGMVQGQQAGQIIPFSSDRWEITGEDSRTADYLGRKSLFLKEGFAVVNDSEFTDGIIEYDVAFGPQRGFPGVVWRLQDLNNYEEFYMRPHQSGNPDANQYAPIFNELVGWQLHYGQGYGAPVKYSFNEWIHVKVVVSGRNGEVYINDMDKPELVIPDLKHDIKAGKVGLKAPHFAPAHFANFSYTEMDKPPLKGTRKTPEPAPAGTIVSWQISNTFGEKTLVGKVWLTEAEKEGLTWTPLSAEPSGLTNLAKVQGVGRGKNTVFARVVVVSDKAQIKPMKFGFSDRVKVYVNNQLFYSGNDDYRSRDYRFLGTMGFFDELYVPLKAGENELWLAVSETFGGWGVQARFEDMDGISIK